MTQSVKNRVAQGLRLQRVCMLARDIAGASPPVEARIPIRCEQLDPAGFAALAAVDYYHRPIRALHALHDLGRLFFVARHEGAIVGGVSVERGRAFTIDCTIPLRQGEACLATVFTVPEHRGAGVQPALLDFTCAWLASAGFHTVFSFVNAANAPSLKAFASAGFRSRGVVGYVELFGWHWAYCLARDAGWRYRQKVWFTRKDKYGI